MTNKASDGWSQQNIVHLFCLLLEWKYGIIPLDHHKTQGSCLGLGGTYPNLTSFFKGDGKMWVLVATHVLCFVEQPSRSDYLSGMLRSFSVAFKYFQLPKLLPAFAEISLLLVPTSWAILVMLDLHNAAMLVVAVVALLSTLYAVFHNPSRKPPSVPSKVPFVGHFIGPIRHGPGYLGMLWRVTDSIICDMN